MATVLAFLLIGAFLCICLAYRRQEKKAEQQGGENRPHATIQIGRIGTVHKQPESLYTEDRKINRHWNR